jgi:hypothetical protein
MTSPLALLHKGILRPIDASDVYAQPRAEFLRWEKAGVLLRIAYGYYAHVPEAVRGGSWRPDIESIALGVGQADYGKNNVALMHLSAARIHAAIPRALAVAVVAVPKQRPVLETEFGRIHFVKRDVERLKRIRTDTELGTGWITTVEQTTLDLARRPKLVPDMDLVIEEALASLLQRCDFKKMRTIADKQNMNSTLSRLLKIAKDD